MPGIARTLPTLAALGAIVLAGVSVSSRSGSASPENPDSDRASPAREAPGNRLAGEASPYLQLHAHNPVDWYPWGPEAFARAQEENKPIFLSVGYSTCYWCHVMEREAFSDPEIAAFMNRHFVSIKVDREERPDVDEVYMKATHVLRGRGGWPNSVFLTPDGKPFFAGTYFPPEDRGRRPGFPRVLRSIRAQWEGDRARVIARAEQVARRIEALSQAPSSAGQKAPPLAQSLETAIEQLSRGYDADHGGFGSRTKFPRPSSLELLLAAYAREPEPRLESMLTQTLDAMALGGIYDHVGDGFHRYTVEPTWSIPHFEKMLYDNAQLVGLYARAHKILGRPLYRRVAERTIAYLNRDLSHPEGGFASAQDAQVAGQEGASYVWSSSEIAETLGAEAARRFLSVYRLVPMHENPAFGVLRVRLPVEPALERTGAEDKASLLARFDDERAKLLAVRAKRTQPRRDDKVIAAWNGLAIRGLVDAAEALDRPDYLRRAEKAAHFVLGRLAREDGTLARSYIAGQARERAVLDDYAFLADGLLALHGATGEARWLASARSLADTMLEHFEDPNGGFFLTPEDSELFVRPKPFDDGALPSGNAVALRVLQQLAARSGPEAERYAQAAARLIRAAGPLLERSPSMLPATVVAWARAPKPSPALARKSEPEDGSRKETGGEAFRLPRSEDHVRATLLRPQDDGAASWVVRLAIDEGWHVNANPASLPFLVPTEVRSADGGELEARYPPGREFHPGFAPEPIQVYEGTIDVPLELEPEPAAPPRLTLRFQACDTERCLPPARVELEP